MDTNDWLPAPEGLMVQLRLLTLNHVCTPSDPTSHTMCYTFTANLRGNLVMIMVTRKYLGTYIILESLSKWMAQKYPIIKLLASVGIKIVP